MRRLIAAALASLITTTVLADLAWHEYGTIGLWGRTKQAIVYWDTSVPDFGPWPALPQNDPPKNEWQLIDISNRLPLDAGHVLLHVWTMTGGQLQYGQTCDLTVTFRAAGDPIEGVGNYIVQSRGATERQQVQLWVPLNIDRQFEYAANWTGTAPACSSFGINIELMGYARP